MKENMSRRCNGLNT